MADIDLIQESLTYAQQRHASLLNFSKSAIGERIQFHRDIIGLSLVLLGGIVTLFNVDSTDLVKTSWLLYVAGGLLIIAIIVSIYTRVKLLQFLENTMANTESWLGTISNAVRNLRALIVRTPQANEGEKAVAIQKLIDAEGPIDLPLVGKVGDHAHKFVSVLFVLALILIGLSLLIKISV